MLGIPAPLTRYLTKGCPMPSRYFPLDPPIKVDFHCNHCGAEATAIAGVLAPEEAVQDNRLAFDKLEGLYCPTCFEKIQTGDVVRRHDPLSQPGESAPSEENRRHEQQLTRNETTMNTPTTTARPARASAPAAAPATRTVSFVKEKETKNTVKFQEQPAPSQPPVCGTLYLQQWFAGQANSVQVEISLS